MQRIGVTTQVAASTATATTRLARWLYLGPLLAVISTAALAGLTGHRRAGLAFLAITLAILANVGLFLLLWALLALYLWRVQV